MNYSLYLDQTLNRKQSKSQDGFSHITCAGSPDWNGAVQLLHDRYFCEGSIEFSASFHFITNESLCFFDSNVLHVTYLHLFLKIQLEY